jgi:hypothetical protein
MNDFDKWENEEAEKRKAQYKRDELAVKEKAMREQEKHDAGIGVEDGTEEVEDEED